MCSCGRSSDPAAVTGRDRPSRDRLAETLERLVEHRERQESQRVWDRMMEDRVRGFETPRTLTAKVCRLRARTRPLAL